MKTMQIPVEKSLKNEALS